MKPACPAPDAFGRLGRGRSGARSTCDELQSKVRGCRTEAEFFRCLPRLQGLDRVTLSRWPDPLLHARSIEKFRTKLKSKVGALLLTK